MADKDVPEANATAAAETSDAIEANFSDVRIADAPGAFFTTHCFC